MKSFLFIIPRTPSKLISPMKALLWEVCLDSLKQQTSNNYSIWIIGEHEKEEENITFIKSSAVTKKEKLHFAFEKLTKLSKKPEYIIRFDDDDVISKTLLKDIKNLKFDCYADKYHTYYDITNSKITYSNNSWLPNTMIHKYQHAINKNNPENIPLMVCDHSTAWHHYYQNKNIVFAPKSSPTYLRVLSPTCLSFKQAFNSENLSDIDMEQYKSKISKIRGFDYFSPKGFSESIEQLVELWFTFTNEPIARKKIGFV